jgi:serine/threonine protein phosphatase 1
MGDLKLISKNTSGRDFVVGDLHGCRALLMRALDYVGFNPNVDRVFCTGDLVDRGPESFATLRLIEEPWFYAVAGNHDDMLSQVLSGDCTNEIAGTFAANGGMWFFTLTDEEDFYLRDVLYQKLRALPLVMRVAHEAGPFQVAHAELCTEQGKTLTDAILEFSDLGDFQPTIQWGRSRINDAFEVAFDTQPSPVKNEQGLVLLKPGFEDGLTLTYVGHSIVADPVLYRSHLYIDGGAYLTHQKGPGRLILIEHGIGVVACITASDLPLLEAA